MQQVKNKNSQIKMLLRKELWRKGYQYKKHYNMIDGHPDIVFVNKKIAIFCNSNFWHGFNWKKDKKTLKSTKTFLIRKIERNIVSDKEVPTILEKEGWKVLRFWENEIIK